MRGGNGEGGEEWGERGDGMRVGKDEGETERG